MDAKLTNKQQAFIEYYVTHWNATRAAVDAGYSKKTARFIGAENLTKPIIKAAISARLAEIHMSADEVLARLAEQARASIGAFVQTDDTGTPQGFSMAADRPLHLVKKIAVHKNGWSFEMYDSQAALALIGKAHGIFADQTDHAGAITLRVEYGADDPHEAAASAAIAIHSEPSQA